MSVWDLISLLSTDWNAIIGSVSAAMIAIIGAYGAWRVKIENAKRRETCDDPTCCVTGRKLKKKPKKASSNAKTKK